MSFIAVFFAETGRLRALWRILLQLGLMVLVMALLSIISQFAMVSFKGIETLFMFLGITVSVWIAGKFLDRRSLSGFGLQFNTVFLRDYFAGWLIAALMQFIIVAQFSFSGILTPESLTPSLERLLLWPFWGLLLAMLLVGFHEELWSRGYHLLNMTEGFTSPKMSAISASILATLISSGVFALLHSANPNVTVFSLVNIVLAGVWLALPYLITGSLSLSMGLHAGWNFVMGGVFGLPISGLQASEEASIFSIKTMGNEWFTGGSFGPEGGVACSLALLFGTVLLLFYFRITKQPMALHALFQQKQEVELKSDVPS